MCACFPRVTVLMAVYNGERYLAEAIDGILQQVWRDFEFLIVNDGSTDSSVEILQRYADQDSRIRLVMRENRGLTRSLHDGVLEAKGKLIARMDADDVSLPERLSRQVAAFDRDPKLVVCGSAHDCIDQNGSEWYPYVNPTDD